MTGKKPGPGVAWNPGSITIETCCLNFLIMDSIFNSNRSEECSNMATPKAINLRDISGTLRSGKKWRVSSNNCVCPFCLKQFKGSVGLLRHQPFCKHKASLDQPNLNPPSSECSDFSCFSQECNSVYALTCRDNLHSTRSRSLESELLILGRSKAKDPIRWPKLTDNTAWSSFEDYVFGELQKVWLYPESKAP